MAAVRGLRRPRPLRRAAREDGDLGAGRAAPGARLLPLWACNAGFHPRDRALGIEGGSLSPGVVRMTGLAAARASFAETGALLHDLAGVNVDAKQAERTAEALGRDIAADERDVVEPEPGRAPTMYLGMDGTGVPVRRAELAGRAGKQADGSARTREVKLVAVWAGATDAGGRELPEREPGSVSYSAAVESAATRDADTELAPFARRVEREARRRGFDRAPRRVVLGDGAPWIWNIADELLPGAVQILDLFHAKQHLWDVAKAVYGPGTDMAERWAKRRRDELDDGRIGALLRALHRLHPPQPPPHALPGVPRHGPLRRLRRARGGLQERRRHPLQTPRHALVRGRHRRHGHPALLRPRQPPRRLLDPAQGTGQGTGRSLINKFVVHPLGNAATQSVARGSLHPSPPRHQFGENPTGTLGMKERDRHVRAVGSPTEVDLPQTLGAQTCRFFLHIVAAVAPVVQTGPEALQVFVRAGFSYDGNQHFNARFASAYLEHVVVGAFRREIGAVGQWRAGVQGEPHPRFKRCAGFVDAVRDDADMV